MLMKKILVIVVAMFALASSASAQSALGNFIKDSATKLLDQATDGKVSELLLVGSWTYNAPALDLVSTNTVANLAGSALTSAVEGKLQKAYDSVGIKQGSCAFTFNNDNTFSATIGKLSLAGSYTYDSSTHAIELQFDTKIINIPQMKGTAYVEGDGLKLLFDCTRLMNFVSALGAKSTLLKPVTSLLSSYENALIGFSLVKN